ncbi:MAG TPA: VOC family protein [Candidatus Dormibacteraeota bacterium]|nr:VOC family protein [Candidatus Dormibacteraeota bacterium]
MPVKDGSLEHLDISVSNLEHSGDFWAAFLKDLGYREFAKSATGWSWTNDETTVFLLQAEPEYLDPPYHRKRVGLNHLAFGVAEPKEVDAMAARLKERNIPLLYGGPRTGRTTYAVFFEDPDRIKIEVVAPLVARSIPSAGQISSPARGGGKGGDADGSITATEVITYAGALVTLAGLGTLLGTQYRQLGVIGRLAIPGLVAVAALLVARALPGERARARRAQTSLITLAVAAIGLFTGQLQAEILGGPDASIPPHTGYRILLVSAIVAAVLTAVFLVRLRSGLLAAALSVSLLVATIASIAWLQLDHGWAVELVFLATAAILVAAAEYGRQEKVIWATEVLAFAGPSMAIITAFITAQDGNLALEIFGALLAGAAFAASVLRGSAGYAFAGGVGLFAFVLDIEFRYFQSSLGFAVSLVISGLVLLGIALLLARLVPRLRR